MLAARFRVEFMNIAGLFKHHRARTRIQRLHVEVGKLGNLRQLLCFRIEAPDVGHAVTVGDKKDRVANPGRIDIFRIRPRRRDQVETLQIHNPDRPVLPAAIVAPLLIPGSVHAVGNMSAIGRNLALVAAR